MSNKGFEYHGVNHVALVCKDMKKTVEFYTEVLEMKLVKTISFPGGRGQHFFFDAGNGATIAFFWFPDAPEAAPGIAGQHTDRSKGIASAHGSMNHLAISIPLEKFDEYRERLEKKGVSIRVINHTDTPEGYEVELTDKTWIRSMYFRDPDGIAMELAAYTRAFNDSDVQHEPATAADAECFREESAMA
jgi:catechol 2,3-dioxygenase-like lactoylglutathione lyase family enzyme